MHGDHMPDQFLQLFRRVPFLPREEGQIFPQAHFIAIHRELIQPDALLWKFRVIELRP